MTAGIWKVGTNNAFSTTLNGGITNTDETINLTTTTGLQYPGVIVIDRIDANNVSTPTTREYISFTGISGNSITGCERGLGGSTAQSHSSGAKVEEAWSVTHWNDFIDAFVAEHSVAGVHDATKVVTPTDTQTLTNKTLTSPVLTTPKITKRVVTTTDDATAEINCDTTDDYELSAVANATEFTVTGTPTDGQTLVIRYKDAGVAKGLTFTGFTAVGATIPTTTVAGKWGYVGAKYNSAATTWHILVAQDEA